MKKAATRIAAAMLTAAMMSAYPVAYADVDPLTYTPSFYFGSADEKFTVDSSGELNFDRELLKDGDYTLKLAVYIHDETLKVWDIRAKWMCTDEHIKLANVVDPKKPLIPYTYAEADASGQLINNDTETSTYFNADKNVMAMTCFYSSSNDSTPLKPYGETTDDYPLTYFEAVIDKDTPAGSYEIVFRTEENSPYPDIINTNLRTEKGPRVVYQDSSSLQNLKINVVEKEVPVTATTSTSDVTTTTTADTTTTVTSTTSTAVTSAEPVTTSASTTALPIATEPVAEDYKLGDVDENGVIDASDATLTLQTYGELSTNRPASISARQQKAADTNKDGKIDSSDATDILMYYSYLSTGGKDSFSDYLKSSR